MRTLVYAILLLALGCTRGCPLDCRSGGKPTVDCKTDRDCKAPETCHEGHCHEPAFVENDQRCKDQPECKKAGACRPGLTRSFLGRSSKPTCLVGRAEDCAASTDCQQFGRCGFARTTDPLHDGYCTATDDKMCAASTRCTSHEECTHVEGRCVRAWTDCSDTSWPVLSGRADLGATWNPGAIDNAILVCRLDLANNPRHPSLVKIGGRCLKGPSITSKTTSLVWRGRLAPNETVTISVAEEPKRATAGLATYIKATYTGTSPFAGNDAGAQLTCHVVPEAMAEPNARMALARLESELARQGRMTPDLGDLQPEPYAITSARASLAEAAMWLGDGHALVRKHAAQLEAVVAAWQRALEAAFAKLQPSDGSGPQGSKIRVHALVCGEALRARAGKLAEGRAIAADHCGVELAFHTGSGEVRFDGPSIGGIAKLHFLRRAHADRPAAPIEGMLIDVRANANAKPQASLSVPANDDVLVLVAPTSLDLALGKGKRDVDALVTGADMIGKGRFVLRTDL